ncbi:GIP [Symbiodinium pilosum]|uniref:GIP protein n=1 Tax=Symbiodinium pilosum TaxID=2952 RepID=A0A812Y8X5_SYMPI|nr:GIP [Symbiodinium pilosum]
MVRKQWSAGVVDIKTAFLNAELEGQDLGAKRVMVRTPGLWRRIGVCTEMFWDVHRALYGLQISPAAWSRCRDRTLPSLKLHTCSGVVRLHQFRSDGDIWAIVPVDAEDPDDASLRLGLLLVYVDDMMILSTPQIIADVIAELGKTWELSQPELLDDGNVHYRGVEICRGKGGVLVHQGSYTQELLARYPDGGGAEVPALKLPDIAPADRQDPSTVRKAQQVAGELLWLSGITRPELQFAVGMISRTISVNAAEACAMGEQVVKYLRRFPARGIWYGSANMSWGEEGDLSQPMGPNSLVGFCDASFAPSSGRSFQSTLAYYSGGLIAWSATRQGMTRMTTLSTAESELVGITSLFADLRALEPLAREIHGAPVTMQMHSGSQAAIAICSTQANNWRARHLRIRASYVREALESGSYTLHHVNGASMKADIGTKPLPGPRFHQLVTALGMAEQPVTRAKRLAVGDGSVEEKIKILLTCLVVASLLEPVEAQTGSSQGLGDRDWQFLFGYVDDVAIVAHETVYSVMLNRLNAKLKDTWKG